jgi:hypothetical protein
VKHQVFFFLLIFSCATYAMDRFLAISRVTNEQIVTALKSYYDWCPQLVDKEKMDSEIKRIRETTLTFEDKKEIVEKMEQFPRPIAIGNRIIFVERGDYESQSNDSIH